MELEAWKRRQELLKAKRQWAKKLSISNVCVQIEYIPKISDPENDIYLTGKKPQPLPKRQQRKNTNKR